MSLALLKGPINQFKPVQQSRKQVLRAYCPNIYIYTSIHIYIYFIFLGKKGKHSAKKEASQDNMELHSFDLTHNISNLIHDLNFFDDGQFKACYSRYHANDDLGQIFLSV